MLDLLDVQLDVLKFGKSEDPGDLQYAQGSSFILAISDIQLILPIAPL